jgi:hypothetical protein
MSNKFNKVLTAGIGTSSSTIYTTNSATSATVIGINIANTTDADITVSIQLTDENNVTGYVVKSALIPKNQALAVMGGDQKLILVANNSLKASSSVASSADIIVSSVEIY